MDGYRGLENWISKSFWEIKTDSLWLEWKLFFVSYRWILKFRLDYLNQLHQVYHAKSTLLKSNHSQRIKYKYKSNLLFKKYKHQCWWVCLAFVISSREFQCEIHWPTRWKSRYPRILVRPVAETLDLVYFGRKFSIHEVVRK